MALAGIELRYLVGEISREAGGYYVSNVYGISRDSLLLKLHHTERPDLFLMVSTMGVWLTSVKIGQIEPNRLQRRLRSDILRLKLAGIRQLGAERIAYLHFEGFGREFVLVAEFFGDGNIILCSDAMKILALQHSIDVRHRKLGVGLEYVPPPQNGLDIFGITEGDFYSMKQSDVIAAKWAGRTLGLPRRYAEGVLRLAGVDPGEKASRLTFEQIGAVFEATKRTVSDVAGGNHTPVIVRGEACPVSFGGEDGTPAASFMEGLDSVFTESLLSRGREARSTESNKKADELRSQLAEQERAIDTVRERSGAITAVANSMYSMISRGMSSLRDPGAAGALEGLGARMVSEKGQPLVEVAGRRIAVSLDAPLQSVASALFDEAKRQSRAIGSVEEARGRTRRRLDELLSRAESEAGSVTVSEIRRKNWYERYRWFFTSDGHLAIGGRDAASNSAVVRKHMADGDRIFHADIFGSPFFILKEAPGASEVSIAEVAQATVCFSRAWREGLYGVSSYWVGPGQVKKSAPSGEFLPKGSFTIEGQRNFVRSETLRLAVGVVPQEGGHAVTCGPVGPVKQASVLYAVIEPQGAELSEAAKRVRTEFSRLDGGLARGIPLDDIVRAMPAGKSQVKEAGRGGAA